MRTTRQEFEVRLRPDGSVSGPLRFPLAADMFDWHNRHSQGDKFLLLYEYLVLINPSGDVDRFARGTKNYLGGFAKENVSRNALPHFTIANLVLFNSEEPRLTAALRAAAVRTRPGRIDIRGFEKWNSGVIFLKPGQNDFFAALQASLMASMRRQGFKIHRRDFPSTPHLTILKNLNSAELHTCWMALTNLHYAGSFTADTIKIIKRPYEGTTSYYQVCAEKFTGQTDSMHRCPQALQQVLF